jgi:segregation and condensation protein A
VTVAIERAAEEGAGFHVHLPVFTGPFDLLLTLIGRHQLDLTKVALAAVTDEFLAHTRALGQHWDLGQATEFLVVAATLLDLKVARLLPSVAEPEAEDLALLEARDLLFARLLQYRAYKQAARLLAGLISDAARQLPRTAGLEAHHAAALPEVVLGLGPAAFARLAALALAPREIPQVNVTHVHFPRVDVHEQMAVVLQRLAGGAVSFRMLSADCRHPIEVVGRFLALLELYRDGWIAFDQSEALGELQVHRLIGEGGHE